VRTGDDALVNCVSQQRAFLAHQISIRRFTEEAVLTANSVTQWPKYDDDNTFVERARAGDVEAFGILYGRYRRRMFNVCMRMVEEPFLAEDLLEESFLCAFRQIHAFRGDSLFSTWLQRITVNAVLMHFRRCKANPIKAVGTELNYEEGDILDGEQFRVEDRHLTLAVERIALEKAINSLPRGYRMMVVLHDIQGFGHSEIAAILGCTPGNTKSQLFKARRRLRRLFMGSEKEPESGMCSRTAA
jgi:RNA polymerase sigma-70 factor (ECF subfamily)